MNLGKKRDSARPGVIGLYNTQRDGLEMVVSYA